MKSALLFAFATMSVLLAASTQAAAQGVYVSTDETSFDSARPGLTMTGFSFPPGYTNLLSNSSSYTSNDVSYGLGTNTTGSIYGYDNSQGSFLGLRGFSTLFVNYNVDYTGTVLAFVLDAPSAVTVDYSVNGIVQSPIELSNQKSFLGIDTGTTGYVDVNFSLPSLEPDAVNIFAIQTGVPEPSTWALLIAGIGGIALMLRRDRKIAFAT